MALREFRMKKVFIFLIIASTLFSASKKLDGSKIYTQYGCYGCHGVYAGGGNGFPKLAGKSIHYLTKKLEGYRNGTIKSNRADMMRAFAKDLSNEEIKALAVYLNNLSRKKDEEEYYEEFTIGDSSGS